MHYHQRRRNTRKRSKTSAYCPRCQSFCLKWRRLTGYSSHFTAFCDVCTLHVPRGLQSAKRYITLALPFIHSHKPKETLSFVPIFSKCFPENIHLTIGCAKVSQPLSLIKDFLLHCKVFPCHDKHCPLPLKGNLSRLCYSTSLKLKLSVCLQSWYTLFYSTARLNANLRVKIKHLFYQSISEMSSFLN